MIFPHSTLNIFYTYVGNFGPHIMIMEQDHYGTNASHFSGLNNASP